MDPIVTDDERVNELRKRTAEVIRSIHPALDIHDFRFVRGQTHTNLIFDIRLPFEVKMTESELLAAAAEAVRTIDPTFLTVITVDRG